MTSRGTRLGLLGEPSVTVLRGVNTSAGQGYNRAVNGVVKPRGGLFGHSNPYLHNMGQTTNSRLTSWTTNGDVARNYALRTSEQGVILRVTVPISKLIKSPNTRDILLIHKTHLGNIGESEVLLRGKIKKNIDITEIKAPKE